ncbi:MAG: hypothetical protein F6J99_28845 [Moorea sp. SIO4G3]|nr:hypothetical protein [Moorena sp. SIO4G3]
MQRGLGGFPHERLHQDTARPVTHHGVKQQKRCSAVLGRQRGLGGSHGAYKVRKQVPHTDPKP